MGATPDGESVSQLLDSKLYKYRKDNPDAIISFNKDIKLKQGIYTKNSVVDFSYITQLLNSEITNQTTDLDCKGRCSHYNCQKKRNNINRAQKIKSGNRHKMLCWRYCRSFPYRAYDFG